MVFSRFGTSYEDTLIRIEHDSLLLKPELFNRLIGITKPTYQKPIITIEQQGNWLYLKTMVENLPHFSPKKHDPIGYLYTEALKTDRLPYEDDAEFYKYHSEFLIDQLFCKKLKELDIPVTQKETNNPFEPRRG